MGVFLILPASTDIATHAQYDAAGRRSLIETFNSSELPARTWYRFSSAAYTKVDDLQSAQAIEPGFSSGKSYTYDYSADGTRRLVRSHASATTSQT